MQAMRVNEDFKYTKETINKKKKNIIALDFRSMMMK